MIHKRYFILLLIFSSITHSAEFDFAKLDFKEIKAATLEILQGDSEISDFGFEQDQMFAQITKLLKQIPGEETKQLMTKTVTDATDECIERQEDGKQIPQNIYIQILQKHTYLQLAPIVSKDQLQNKLPTPCFAPRCLKRGTQVHQSKIYCSGKCRRADK